VWLSIFFAGIPCGYAIGYVSGGLFASQLSWRLAFVAEALFVAPFAIACLFIPKSRSAQPGAASADGAAPKHSVMTSFKILVLNGTYMFNCLGYAALTGCLGSFAFWLPSFLVDYFSMDITEANLYLGVIALSTGIGGTGFGGVMLDKIGGSVGIAGAGRALLLCWIFCLVGFPLAMGALLSGQFHAFFALMFCAQFFLFASTSPIGAAVLSSVPNSLRSHAMALSIAIIHLLGDFPSPVILGVIADAWSLYYAMLMFTFFLILASALFLVAWILARKRAAREKDSETKSLLPAQPADGNMLRSQEVML
jgi:MFS family permease